MSDDDATHVRWRPARTPGPWTPNGDKIRAHTAAERPDRRQRLVAYSGAHWQRLGLKTYPRGGDVPEHAPDVSSWPLPAPRCPTAWTGSTASATFTARWGEQAPEDADATST